MLGSPENINGTPRITETEPELHYRKAWDISYQRILGAAAALSLACTLVVDTDRLSPAHTRASSDSNTAQASVSPTHEPTEITTRNVRSSAISSSTGKKHCTTLRRKQNDIYMAKGCAENGDTLNVLDEVPVVKGWALSIMVVDGIYKCGFGRPGVLPKAKLHENAEMRCRNYYPSLVEDAFAFFEDWNCSEKKPCRDGTYYSPVSDRCTNTSQYRNFASDDPSPFNMFGTGNGGFSDKMKGKKTSVRYRVQAKPNSQDGKAIVVRSPKWGLMRDECVDKGKVRRGGTRVKPEDR